MNNIRLISCSILFATISIVGLSFFQVYDELKKSELEKQVLLEEKKTAIKEREKYELQIEYLQIQVDTEKQRFEVYKSLRK